MATGRFTEHEHDSKNRLRARAPLNLAVELSTVEACGFV
jgi:hypothetical protein